MSILEQNWFSRISRPSRYLGNEINAIRKDHSSIEVSIALGFPDVYEVGMSHVGLKILYQILNDTEWIAAERAFCPWTDLEEELRARKLPLTSMETQRPLNAFDVVGFSLQNELSATNVLTMLDLAGIPFLAEEREPPFPLVIAGGPACFNPEPMAPLFDAVVVGDGEEAALEICRTIRRVRAQEVWTKHDLLLELTKIQGVYVPRFFMTRYHLDGTVRQVEPTLAGYPRVRKAIVPDLNRHPFPVRQIVPFTELVHDRLSIEIARGCTRGCRFCQAGMIYRPVRERDPRQVVQDAEEALGLTGFEELSLLSLSSGDYSSIGPLLTTLMDRQTEDKVAVSFPSLRIDSLNPQWLEQIKRVRKTGFTLAPEAGNDRLRQTINKGLTDADILRTARAVYGSGWKLIKLYFMVGLPGEEEEDVRDIIRLSREIISLVKGRGKKASLNVSVAVFVPKAHTPFMWVPQISLEEGRRRIGMVQSAFQNDRRVRVKWNQPEMSWFEGVFSRGDRRLCRALIEAWNLGARFDAWGEHFNKSLWEEALQKTGLDPNFYLYRERSAAETLPWDHIDSGVRKDYFRKEYQRALDGKTTPDCREKCLECGVCDHRSVAPVLLRDPMPSLSSERHRDAETARESRKYRITFTKTDSAKYLSHLELVRLFIRAFKRAGLHLVYSKGYHPMPKVSFATALPVGTESVHETVNIEVYDSLGRSEGKELLAQQLPQGIRITAMDDVTLEKKAPKLTMSHFTITFEGGRFDKDALKRFQDADQFPVTKTGKKGERLVDGKEVVESMTLLSSASMRLVLRHIAGVELKPIEIMKHVCGLSEGEIERIKILKTMQVMG